MTKSLVLPTVAVLLVASMVSLIAFGILGLRKPPGPRNFDGTVLYAAGRAWMDGRNPYDPAELYATVRDDPSVTQVPDSFGYPPLVSPLCLALASFPYATATKLWLMANLLSIAALVWMSIVMIWQGPGGSEDYLGMGLLTAVIIGNFFTTNVVWIGQTSLVVSAFAMASWLFHQRKQWLLAGTFLALASFKPQLFILLGVWFLLERDWKTLLSALAAGLVLCLYPMLVQGGPIGMLEAWMGSLAGYTNSVCNTPGDPHMVGLQSLLAAAGLVLPRWPFALAGVALVVMLRVFRHRLHGSNLLGILLGTTFFFVGYAHDYDLVALVPALLVAVWPRCRQHPLAAVAIVFLLLLLFFPLQLVRAWEAKQVALHWRTLVVLVLTLIAIGCSLNRPKGQETSVAV